MIFNLNGFIKLLTMLKYIILLSLSLCFLSGCNINKDKKSGNLEGAIYWSNASIIKNKALISFLNGFSIENPSDLAMFIGQYRDTIIATLCPLRIDLNVKQLQPVGYMNINKKKIYILMPISVIMINDGSSLVQRNFELAIDSISNKNHIKSNLVLIKIPMYSDTLIVSKDRQRISYYFQPTIKPDVPIINPNRLK